MTTERMPEEVSKIFQDNPEPWMGTQNYTVTQGVPESKVYELVMDPPKPVSVQTCFRKLIRAGFRVIRRQDNIIKECRALNADLTQFEWYHLEKFKSKAAAQRAMNELLQDNKTIEL